MGQTNIIKDGQTVTLPFEEATGRQLKQQLAIPAQRHVTITEDGESRKVGDHETVTLRPGTIISDIPHWRAGSDSQPRDIVGARLTVETNYLSAVYQQEVTFGFDPDLRKWWAKTRFCMPGGWNHEATPILVVVSNQYPASPPDGFYLSKKLKDSRGRTPAHYFERQHMHNSLTERGWAWFCCHPTGWRAAVDVQDGDNLLKYMSLIHLVLSDASKGDL